MWSFGRSSGTESQAEAAEIACVLFPLTPALSPRRGRTFRPCLGDTTELGRRAPPKRKTKRRGLQPHHPNFPALCQCSPSPWGEGGGEGERNELPQMCDDAFTLLEVLIAVVTFGIVLAAMNAVFYGALRLRNKTTEALK